MFKTPQVAALAVAAAALFSGAAGATTLTFTATNSDSGDGYVSGTYPDFTLVSSNNYQGGSTLLYSTTFVSNGQITFDWSYTTSDWDGSYDPAGYYLGGTYYQLSSDSAQTGVTYSGTTTVDVVAGESFGFYDYSVDSGFGSSALAVHVTSVVPEPANVMLMLAGLGALGAVARRRKSA